MPIFASPENTPHLSPDERERVLREDREALKLEKEGLIEDMIFKGRCIGHEEKPEKDTGIDLFGGKPIDE